MPNALRRLTFVSLTLASSCLLSAAIWENPRWALSAATEAGAGYDSNLFARSGSEGDGYVLFEPALSLQRLNSLTYLTTTVSVRTLSFFDHRDLNSVDPELLVRLRYPNDEVLAKQEFEARVNRRSESNFDVGGRLRSNTAEAKWEGSYAVTGKVSLLPRLSAGRTEYENDGYADNEAGSVGLTAAYVSNERFRVGAGYDFEYSKSIPDDEELSEATYGRRHLFTLRARGEFLPKVTTNAFVGLSHDEYEGWVSRSDWDFVAGGNVTWEQTERRSYTLKLNRNSYFSPSGSSSTVSEIGLQATQEIRGGFTVSLSSNLGTVKFRNRDSTTSADRYTIEAEAKYMFTQRFSAGLKAAFNTNHSAVSTYDFDESGFYTHAALRF